MYRVAGGASPAGCWAISHAQRRASKATAFKDDNFQIMGPHWCHPSSPLPSLSTTTVPRCSRDSGIHQSSDSITAGPCGTLPDASEATSALASAPYIGERRLLELGPQWWRRELEAKLNIQQRCSLPTKKSRWQEGRQKEQELFYYCVCVCAGTWVVSRRKTKSRGESETRMWQRKGKGVARCQNSTC